MACTSVLLQSLVLFFYVRYAIFYRDLEEILAKRGIRIDHTTLNRWVVKYLSDIAKAAQTRKQSTAGSWRMLNSSKIRLNQPQENFATEPKISIRCLVRENFRPTFIRNRPARLAPFLSITILNDRQLT